MSSDPLFAFYAAFRKSAAIAPTPANTEAVSSELAELFEKRSGTVDLRGAYSCEGFRPDTDVLFWMTASSADDLQDFYISMRKTALGAALEPSHIFLGVVRPPEFNPEHVPAFARGEPPRRYLCVYPFVRTAEWYLMDPQKRAELLREHGQMGREFPEVLANTTSGFGLGDWEWILAFESDDLVKIVDCIRRLRDAEARRYTQLDTPFVVGIRKSLNLVVDDLV
jgi:peroxiredoxin